YFTVSGKSYAKDNEAATVRPAVKKQAGAFSPHERQQSSENCRNVSREKQQAAAKTLPVKTGSSVTEVKKGMVRPESGHTISFEDDEDFKPV
ncbi:MAG: hypothetical protein WCR31_09970, partial [Treponema sp.]